MKSIYQRTARAVQQGFTLVELLIVVIILAILAAIVIPQFSSSTSDAKEAAIKANLAALRSAIELYKVQHNGVYPSGVLAGDPGCTNPIVTVAGAVDTEAAFKAQLLNYTDAAGKTCNGPDVKTTLGPYLRKGVPADPLLSVATVTVQKTGAPLAPAAGAAGGWLFDNKSGQIVFNHDGTDTKGVAYATY